MRQRPRMPFFCFMALKDQGEHSCGCNLQKRKSASNKIDISGKKFGRLTAIKSIYKYRKTGNYWECICECGKTTFVKSNNLRAGITKSCGCLSIEVATERVQTHGLSNSKIHSVWNAMIQRCTNPNTKRYARYGGRGISVCERWLIFDNFLEDMGLSYKYGLSIERENVHGNYELSNCKWATTYEQSRNRTDNVFMNHKGQIKIMTDWAKDVGLNVSTVWARLNKGWSDHDALSVPLMGRRKKISLE